MPKKYKKIEPGMEIRYHGQTALVLAVNRYWIEGKMIGGDVWIERNGKETRVSLNKLLRRKR